jgi:hypothetical protein
MPQLVLTLALSYGAYTAGYIAFSTFVSIAIAATISTVSSYIFKPKMPKFSDIGGRQEMVRQPITTRKIIYGRQKVSGPIVALASSSKDIGDSKVLDDAYLHILVALAGHELNAIEEVYLDEIALTLDGSDLATNTQFRVDDDGDQLVYVKKYLGTTDQTADPTLVATFPDLWTTDHRLQEVAYLYVRLEFNSQVFSGGIPNVSAIVQGKKVYDYRTTTTVFSSNPALILSDYLKDTKYGLGISGAELDESAVITAANICDEDVTLAGGGTENRYECHGVIDTAKNPGQVIEELLSSMAGQMSYVGGEWVMRAGAYVAPAMTLTLDDVRGPINVQTKSNRAEIFNAVKGVFINPEANWQATDYASITSATFEAEDNDQRIFVDMSLPFTTSHAMAQRLAKIGLYRARQEISVQLPCKMQAFDLRPGDTVSLTIDRYGWNAKVFEVVLWKFAVNENELGVDLELREINANVFDWDAEEQAFRQDNTNLPNSDSRPPVITGLAASDSGFVANDGTYFPVTTVAWDTVESVFVAAGGFIEFQIKVADEVIWGPTQVIPGDQTSTKFEGGEPGLAFDFRIRARNPGGVIGIWAYLDDYVLPGDTTAPGIPTGLTATGSDGAIQLNWTNPNDDDLYQILIYENTVNDSATASAIGNVSGSAFVRAGLAANVTRYYFVKAQDFSGNQSGFSTGASATTASSVDTPRTTTGYIYYGLSSASAPTAPTVGAYSFSSNTFASLSANWSLTFTAPSGGGQFWAVRYSVVEDTFGGAQTITLSSVFKWQNFDGIVTFSNIEDSIEDNVTIIDGGKITTNTLSADRIQSNTTKTANSTTFGLGTSTTVGGINAGAQFMSTSATYFGCIIGNNAAASALGVGTTDSAGTNGAIFAIGNANSIYSTWSVATAIASGTYGLSTINVNAATDAAIVLASAVSGGTAYAYYIISGTTGPFTASHDGLQRLTADEPELGDIMVDVALVAAPSVNDSITEVAVSSSANQQGVLGVFAGVNTTDFVPASLGESVISGPAEQRSFVLKPEFANIYETYRSVAVNAIGEGKVNVCGQNGDIAIGDLIVASDNAGKGMKQDDNIVRSITVAKARENVTFASPTEVKQIACIYMGG